MESFMNGVMMVQAGLLSVLLAVWMTWLVLHGLFRGCSWYMQPAKNAASGNGGRSLGSSQSKERAAQSGDSSRLRADAA